MRHGKQIALRVNDKSGSKKNKLVSTVGFKKLHAAVTIAHMNILKHI
jgi:hypothetical protein